MAAAEHIYDCRERGHRHIFPSEIPAYKYRETDSTTCGLDILGAEPGLLG